MQLLFSFDQDMRVEKTLIQTLACQLSSTLMQLLFSFDQNISCKLSLLSTLINSHATLVLVWPGQAMRARKLSYKLSLGNSHLTLGHESWPKHLIQTLSLVNSHQLSCNSCSRLTRTWELRKLSYKLSLVNSHQLSCNSCSRLTRTWELRKLSYKLSLVNSHAASCNKSFSKNCLKDTCCNKTSLPQQSSGSDNALKILK